LDTCELNPEGEFSHISSQHSGDPRIIQLRSPELVLFGKMKKLSLRGGVESGFSTPETAKYHHDFL